MTLQNQSIEVQLYFKHIVEILARLKYSNLHSKPTNEGVQTIFVYAEMGKLLKSELIGDAVLRILGEIEKEIVIDGNAKVRRDLERYSQLGKIKKKLYSLPQYVLDLNRKGVKLPEQKVRAPLQKTSLNISRIRG